MCRSLLTVFFIIFILLQSCKKDTALDEHQPGEVQQTNIRTLTGTWQPGAPLIDGIWVIMPVTTQKTVEVRGVSKTPGVVIQQWDGVPNDGQRWRITKTGTHYSVINLNSGLALEVPAGAVAGTQLKQNTYTGADNQLWAITSPGLTVYTFTNKLTGMRMTLENKAVPNGSKITQRTASADTSQYFFMVNSNFYTGPKTRIYDGGHGTGTNAWYINDHTIIYDEKTRVYHMFGITHQEPGNAFAEISFAHATATRPNQSQWIRQPDIMHDVSEGEANIWAPHVIYKNGLYYMFYGAGVGTNPVFGMQVRTSPDLYNWSAPVTLFKDGVWGRDPFVTQINGQWVIYYTATKDPYQNVQYILPYYINATGDLTSPAAWGARKIAFTQDISRERSGLWTESPQVIKRGDYYYLFICQRSGHGYNRTDVFRSTDPFNFDHRRQVGMLNLHAAEILYEPITRKWYATHAGWGAGGLYYTLLDWGPY